MFLLALSWPIAFVSDADELSNGFGPQQVISSSADLATSVFAADLDGDGDIDVLSSSGNDDKIAWYENTDGDGSFGPQLIITRLADRPFSVFAADMDGDGDLDVLSASVSDNKIAWYENADGAGSFGPQLVITILADGAVSVYAADLDDDGDLDVLSASAFDDKIAWYENIDGAGSFGPQQVITKLADRARSVSAADLDGDGDLDVLSASESDDKIAWYENTDGAGSFGPQQLITRLADGPISAFAADLDGDGDLDVLSASQIDDKIAWYENDGTGSFGPQQVITILAIGAHSVFAADLDRDGDLDVLSASRRRERVAWYENTDGTGSFGPQLVITDSAVGAHSVIAADLDDDGDLDVLSASVGDDKIAWYESLQNTVVSVDIDIKPGSDFNPINVRSNGVIPVAILGSDTFDVADVDVTTLAFGPVGAIGAAPAHTKGGHQADANDDGLTDLLSHYRTQETGIGAEDTEACVVGETFDGTTFESCDEILVISMCGLGFELALLLPGVMWLRQRRRVN